MELFVAIGLLVFWTIFSIIYTNRFKKHQLNKSIKDNAFWNNQYIFDTIPSVFPTLGILGTAIGITVGLWNFDTLKITESLPELLKGLKSAFIATMLGIIGLIIFQKYLAVVQKQIDDDPNRPIKSTDELTALAELKLSFEKLTQKTEYGLNEIVSKSKEENKALIEQIVKLESELKSIQKTGNLTNEQLKTVENSVNSASQLNSKDSKDISSQIKELKEEQIGTSKTANENTLKIIQAMGSNNELIRKKFDEFSDLLAKNNTEALVEVMKTATEQFNAQMRDLIDKLVQENFKELNNSVQSLNSWQQENKEHIEKLTNQFIDVSNNLQISSKTLTIVAQNTSELTSDNSRLVELIKILEDAFVHGTKLSDMTERLDKTTLSVQAATDEFADITSNVNNWANKQSIFNDKIQAVVVQLDEFKNFNGNLWESYRKEMTEAVSIIKKSSQNLDKDLSKINQEFYERLNDTLANLDECIQRIVIGGVKK